DQKELLTMIVKLFCLLEQERTETMQFLFATNCEIHKWKYREAGAPKTAIKPSDLLYHQPSLQCYIDEAIADVAPLSKLLARQAQHVANGHKLDLIYSGLNEDKPLEHSKLSGIANLLGN